VDQDPYISDSPGVPIVPRAYFASNDVIAAGGRRQRRRYQHHIAPRCGGSTGEKRSLKPRAGLVVQENSAQYVLLKVRWRHLKFESHSSYTRILGDGFRVYTRDYWFEELAVDVYSMHPIVVADNIPTSNTAPSFLHPCPLPIDPCLLMCLNVTAQSLPCSLLSQVFGPRAHYTTYLC
jgi:hypothetical protein